MSTFQELIADDTPVLVDFFATWCGPCRMMAPELEKLKQDLGAAVRILKIDVDKNQQTAMTYRVSGVPTLILFRKGHILWRQSGAMSARQLSEIIRSKTAS